MVSGASISGLIALRQRAVASTIISVLNWPILLMSSSNSLDIKKKYQAFVREVDHMTSYDLCMCSLPSYLAQRMHYDFINVLHDAEDGNLVE